MKHTQGPWTCFVGNANGRGLIRIESSSESPIPGKHICSMPRGEISEQNALLIAAAPELLDACKEAILQIEYLHSKFKETGSGNNVVSRLQAAIAKTEGE